jgi:hypothetical protein
MESTWASGASELLRHADSHINLNTAFDKRIAFISIDNCVENIIRTCLTLPSKKSGFKVKRKDLDEAGNSFPKLLSLLFQYASEKLVGIDEADIEHYHRIRNTLYHNGTGLSVDDEYLIAYRDIAGIILNNLFEVSVTPSTSESDSLGKLIINWNTIERDIKEKLEASGVSGTYKWEEAFALGLLEPSDVQLLTELRRARNRLVHSKEIDKEDILYWLDVSERFIPKIQSVIVPTGSNQESELIDTEAVAASPAEVSISYKKLNITQEIHKYSLLVSVKLLQTPDQDFFRISFLWPAHIPIAKIHGFEEGEEQNIKGQHYQEYALFVDKRLWPGQEMKIVGGKAAAVLEYEFNNEVYMARHQKAFELYYTLFLQSWQPVQGKVSFENLNNY